MHHEAIIRAWKDEAFRNSLTDDERAHLPDHPAGLVEISDDDLFRTAGGTTPATISISLSLASAATVSVLASCLGKEVCG